jgi:mediator of RNA polymerase II transcription subunit 17
MNETLMAIDFTSLLESKYLPKQGEQSISAYLKQKLPLGSLAYDKWETSPQSKKRKIDENLVAKGWRMEGLTSAADLFLGAAKRLEQDTRRESNYWSQVLGVKEKGWPVFRHPRNPQSLSVQVGSRESVALFAERGIVTFKADEEGTISLSQSVKSEPKVVRVRVSRKGSIVGGSSTLAPRPDPESKTPLESLVHEARDALFEEELFHEIRVETRSLLSLGVKLRDRTIHIPSAPQAEIADAADEILIDVVPVDQVPAAGQDTSSDELAQSLALSLRLLLSHLHRSRLRRRTSKPPPIVENRRPGPASTILRPLMMTLQHQYASWRLKDTFEDVISVLGRAGFKLELDHQHIPKSRNTPPAIGNGVFDRQSLPIISTVSIPLPSNLSKKVSRKEQEEGEELENENENEKESEKEKKEETEIETEKNEEEDLGPHSIIVEIFTQFSQPPFNTGYNLIIPTPLTRILYPRRSVPAPRRLTFPAMDALIKKVYGLISLDITSNVLAPLHPSWKPSPVYPFLGAAVQVDGNERRFDIAVSAGTRTEKVKAEEERSRFVLSVFCKAGFGTRVLNRSRWDMGDEDEDEDEGKGGLVDVVGNWAQQWAAGEKMEDEA